VAAPASGGGFFRASAAASSKPGVYLDGGFGVGKTHLLAALWHARAGPKYFGTFIEYTALVGALGYARGRAAPRRRPALHRRVRARRPGRHHGDDPAARRARRRRHALAATSNTPPNALGEGRFARQDFLREIHALSASFQTLRIDGVDYRHRALEGHAEVLEPARYERVIAEAATTGLVSDDSFEALVSHLARVHPSAVHPDDRRPLRRRTARRRPADRPVRRASFVAFIDRVYDAELPVRATGLSLDLVFADEMLAGGYRKKYLRAISRLVASTLA
jgi:cell division protein ZapE